MYVWGNQVGVADTGIDEDRCYFMDPQGPVPKSLAGHPVTYPDYRKVIQYVNYSGIFMYFYVFLYLYVYVYVWMFIYI